MKTSSPRRKWKNKKTQMKLDLPLSLLKAELKASEIIDEYGITAPEHIRLEDIAFALGEQGL